jgi:hypothetical protein
LWRVTGPNPLLLLANLMPHYSWHWATCGCVSCYTGATFVTSRGDPLLWRRLAVESPLSHRIMDEVLLELTNRIEGSSCRSTSSGAPHISDAGLFCVVEHNPFIAEVL